MVEIYDEHICASAVARLTDCRKARTQITASGCFIVTQSAVINI